MNLNIKLKYMLQLDSHLKWMIIDMLEHIFSLFEWNFRFFLLQNKKASLYILEKECHKVKKFRLPLGWILSLVQHTHELIFQQSLLCHYVKKSVIVLSQVYKILRFIGLIKCSKNENIQENIRRKQKSKMSDVRRFIEWQIDSEYSKKCFLSS